MSNTANNHRLGEPTPAILRVLVLLGHITLIITLASWLLMFVFIGKPYHQTWWIILTALFLGRGPAVGAGLSIHFNAWYLFFITIMADVFLVFYIYPLFVRNYRHLTRVPYIGSYLDNLHTAAVQYKKHVAPYGIAGLLIFVVFPFWSTGPLVGSILGFLIGLSSTATLITVNVGNVAASAVWVLAYDTLHDWNSGAALILLAVLLFLAIGGIIFAQFKHKKKIEEESVDSALEETDNDTADK